MFEYQYPWGFVFLEEHKISIRHFCRPLPVKFGVCRLFFYRPNNCCVETDLQIASEPSRVGDISLDVKISVNEQNPNIIMNWPLNYYFGSSLRGSRELSKGIPTQGQGLNEGQSSETNNISYHIKHVNHGNKILKVGARRLCICPRPRILPINHFRWPFPPKVIHIGNPCPPT